MRSLILLVALSLLSTSRAECQDSVAVSRRALTPSQQTAALCYASVMPAIDQAMQRPDHPLLIVNGSTQTAHRVGKPTKCPVKPTKPDWLDHLQFITPPTSVSLYGPEASAGAIRIQSK